MSDTTASLRRKLDRAADLRAVVRTMKAVAASSIGQFERSVAALAPYDQAVQQGLGACLRATGEAPLRPESPRAAAVGAVVFGSDQGLVGRFNDAVAEHALGALARAHPTPRVWAVGARVQGRLVEAGLTPAQVFAVPQAVEGIAPLVGQLLLESAPEAGPGAVSTLHLFYNRPTADGGYAPTRLRLLPLDEAWRRALADRPWPTKTLPEVLDRGGETLRAFVREHLFVGLFRACAESLASEHASRLAAMQRADQNIGELLDTLHRRFHRLRQARIDEELFDVVSGFEALGGGG